MRQPFPKHIQIISTNGPLHIPPTNANNIYIYICMHSMSNTCPTRVPNMYALTCMSLTCMSQICPKYVAPPSTDIRRTTTDGRRPLTDDRRRPNDRRSSTFGRQPSSDDLRPSTTFGLRPTTFGPGTERPTNDVHPFWVGDQSPPILILTAIGSTCQFSTQVLSFMVK